MSKASILAAIRAQSVPPEELPALNENWITYPDKLTQFASMIAAVGGKCLTVSGLDELNRKLEEIPAWTSAQKVISLVPGAGKTNVDLAAIDDPHELESVDFAILPGQFGVAENGAIWVTGENLRHRVLYFIVQHLALVIPADQIVSNMHEAYERLTPAEKHFGSPGFGAFISGPSKTADIEQSLVIGAHGPRSLTVFCVP